MLTPATLTVNFTANYTGQHRICWRIQGSSGPYVCTNIVDCLGGGNVCQAVISIMVNPESCDPVTYEGYIQATCNPEGSSVDQVPWTSTFVPNPGCKLYQLRYDPSAPCLNPPQLGPVIPAVDMQLNCNGTARPDVVLYCESTILLCSASIIPNLPAGYEMTLFDGCCYDCTQYTVTITPACPGCLLDGSAMYYIDCNTRELKRVNFTGNTPVNVPAFCAVTGSVSLQLPIEATGVVNNIGVCP